jgi:hypothetical protein
MGVGGGVGGLDWECYYECVTVDLLSSVYSQK